MALFDTADLLSDEKKTKERLKTAMASKVNDKGTRFLYYEKFKLGTKDVPLVLVDITSGLLAEVKAKFGKAPTAHGLCRVNPSDELVFEAESGRVKLDAVKTFLASIGVARKVMLDAKTTDDLPEKESKGDAKADAKADAKPDAKPDDGAVRLHVRELAGPAKEGAASKEAIELAKRLKAIAVELKAARPEVRESIETHLPKVEALAKAKREADALVLLGKLEEMLKKATAEPGRELGDLGAALKSAKTQVEAAFAGLPAEHKTVKADLEASKQNKDYETLVKTPSAIADAKLVKAAASALLAHIEATGKLAGDWLKLKASEEAAFGVVFKNGLATAGAENKDKFNTFRDLPESKAAVAMGKEADAYLRPKAYVEAMARMSAVTKQLAERIAAWPAELKKAGDEVKAAIDAHGAVVGPIVRKALLATQEQADFKVVFDAGKVQILDASDLRKPTDGVLRKVAELADLEHRRIRARDLLPKLVEQRKLFDDVLVKSEASIAKTAAALDAVALTFRTATMKGEIDADTLTVTAGRDTTRAELLRFDAAQAVLPTDPPPPAAQLDDAEKLVAATPPDTLAARQRITRNLNALSPDGRIRLIDEMLTEAKTDPLRMLSSNRAGNLAPSLKALDRPAVAAAIQVAVDAQHRPALREWFKVLQLNNASGGALKLGKVGDITRDRKRIPLHMSLYLANVGTPPSIHDPIASIMTALLPPVQGHVGTHVTLELNGEKSKGNPHYFHGAAAGVPNDLDGKADWATIETEMRNKLAAEMARLQGLVQIHIGRMGKWIGE